MEAIDKLRDTSESHERCSVVEVMGRTQVTLLFGPVLRVVQNIFLLLRNIRRYSENYFKNSGQKKTRQEKSYYSKCRGSWKLSRNG